MSVSLLTFKPTPMSMEICRACLVSSESLIPFNDYLITNYNLLTNLNVSIHDSLPKYCCQSCVKAVNFFVQFRQKCTENENTLQNAIEKTKPDVDSLQSNDEEIDSKENILKVEIEFNDNCKDAEEDQEDFSYSFEVGDYSVKEEEQEEHPEPKTKTKKKIIKKISPKVLKSTETDKSQRVEGKRKYKSHKKQKVDCDKSSKGSENTSLDCGKRKYKSHKKQKLDCDKSSKGSENTSLDCGVCVKKNFDENMLKKHLESHKGAKECELCGETVWSWPNLLGHRLQHLPKPQQKCHLCGRLYTSPAYLEYHYLNIHFTEYEKVLKCNKCVRSYPTPRKFSKHQVIHRDVKYLCNDCPKAFNSKSQLVTHMLSHTEKKTVTCDLCPYACKSSTSLKTHKMHMHNPNKTVCKQCSRYFLNQEKLDQHKCKGKMVCPTCGIAVSNNKGMISHMRSHSDVGIFKCDRCPAVYKTATGLKIHSNKHDGIRPYKCDFCPAKFYHYSVLVKHRRIHTGEKPYVCNVCSKSFTGNHNLKVHMRVHGQFLINKKNKTDDEHENDSYF